jgi:hypothetical protein
MHGGACPARLTLNDREARSSNSVMSRDSASAPPPVPVRRIFPPRVRQTVLTAHIIISVGLLGDSAGFLAVALRASHTNDPGSALELVQVLNMFALVFGIPLSVGAILSGITLRLGTRWGVFRYPSGGDEAALDRFGDGRWRACDWPRDRRDAPRPGRYRPRGSSPPRPTMWSPWPSRRRCPCSSRDGPSASDRCLSPDGRLALCDATQSSAAATSGARAGRPGAESAAR